MNPSPGAVAFGGAAALALFTAGLHAALGGRVVLRPVIAAPLASQVRHVVEVVWHVLTWQLLALSAAFSWSAAAPRSAGAEIVAALGGLSALGAAVLFLGLSLVRFGSPWRMPQWTLFLPMAVLAAIGPWLGGRPAPRVGNVAALAAASVLGGLAVLHALWTTGRSWPLRDRSELALTVVGERVRRASVQRVTTMAALLLFAAAAWVLALRGLVFAAPPMGLGRGVLSWGLVGVFTLRGLGGFFEAAVRPAILGTPYQRWNLRVYSPVSVALAVAIGLAAI